MTTGKSIFIQNNYYYSQPTPDFSQPPSAESRDQDQLARHWKEKFELTLEKLNDMTVAREILVESDVERLEAQEDQLRTQITSLQEQRTEWYKTAKNQHNKIAKQDIQIRTLRNELSNLTKRFQQLRRENSNTAQRNVEWMNTANARWHIIQAAIVELRECQRIYQTELEEFDQSDLGVRLSNAIDRLAGAKVVQHKDGGVDIVVVPSREEKGSADVGD